jgi:hypothetical protein
MATQDDDIPDDKLLDMPEGDAPASPLRSNLRYQRQLAELNAELNGTAAPRMLMPWSTPREKAQLEEKHRREQLAYEQQLRGLCIVQAYGAAFQLSSICAKCGRIV